MEYSLRHDVAGSETVKSTVLILILMEYSLRPDEDQKNRTAAVMS